jgi:hypothetical protein
MGGTVVLQNNLLPLTHVSLARLTTSIQTPQRDFHDPFPPQGSVPQLSNNNTTISIQHNVQSLGTSSSTASHSNNLTALLNLYRSKANLQTTSIAAIASLTYELTQWDMLFKRACEREATRHWLESAIEEGKNIFFIVGFRTFVDPSATELGAVSKGSGTGVSIPIAQVAGTSAAVPMASFGLGDALDLGAEWEAQKKVGLSRKWDAKGELVYAVQYCKVQFKWFSSRKIGNSSLGPTKWKIHWGVRAVQEVEEDDVVEAELEEVFDDAEMDEV